MNSVKSINKDNLQIARENMSLDSATASKKIQRSKRNLVAEWETGKSLPTWSHVAKLAKLYNVSELVFFLNETIQRIKTIPDYRTGINKNEDAGIGKLINLVITRQKWLEKELKSEGYKKNQLQGSGRNLNTPKQLADFISNKLDIDLEEIKKLSHRRNALNYLLRKAEDRGIYVGKTVAYHRLKVADMRGLFISNEYCPFIILNRQDALAAQIFSFVHELAHLFRKSDAISNSLEFRKTIQGINPEELFCNKVAAELLLPEQDFTKDLYDKSDIDAISERHKVSKLFIFYRLKDLGKVHRKTVDDLENEIKKETDENLSFKEKNKKSGGDYTNAMKDSNGPLFNRTVQAFYLENKIGYVEAANLLKFSPEMV